MTDMLKRKLKKIELLIMDVDGVLTNGQINVDSAGKELKMFNVQDGFGIVLFQRQGFKTAIISARSTKAVDVRAKDLKISKVYQNAYPKTEAYAKLLKELNIEKDKVCYIGDDVPDICLFSRVGVAVSVPNGAVEARKRADYVTKRAGGNGAVREVVEVILKSKGLWSKIIKEHLC